MVDADRDATLGQLGTELIDSPTHHQAILERTAAADGLVSRLRNFGGHLQGMCFGKLVEADTHDPLYIGRCGVADDQYDQLLIDWRAPVAQAFYRATAMDPMGMELRRHFICDGRTLLGMEDDLLVADSFNGDREQQLVGEAALLAALNRERTGHMGDIVATIQRDQDLIIRAPMKGTIVVSGGPGTGKTVVALHRAAYLLYSHRALIENNGVLVMGPSKLFMTYIERVLPSLGESTVLMKSWANLLPGITGIPDPDPAVAATKGSLAMAEVLARAVQLVRSPDRAQHRRTTPHQVLAALYTDAELLAEATAGVLGEADRDALLNDERWEPTWTVSDLPLLDELADLMGCASLLSVHQHTQAKGVDERLAEADVSDRTMDAIELTYDSGREPSERRGERPAGPLDVDDLGGAHLSGIATAEGVAARYEGRHEQVPLGEQARADATWMFAHIVVDEAQDVSPMQWRALARRSVGRSMTIVGDPDQQSEQPSDWWIDRIKAGLGTEHIDEHRLDINYRTPAALVGPALSLRSRTTDSSRPATTRYVRTGSMPWVLRRDRLDRGAIRDAVVMARAQLGEQGRLAVISASSHRAMVAEALADLGYEHGDGPKRLIRPVAAYDAGEVKGLEFDSVLVVDPDAIEAELGSRQLYVVLTRPTKHLGMVTTHDPQTWPSRWLAEGTVVDAPLTP